jgi:hypothetical protein
MFSKYIFLLSYLIVGLDFRPAFALEGQDVALVTEKLSLNSLGRYMSPDGGCVSISRAGWEGYPTKLCKYKREGVELPVILLDPDIAQLAKWLLSACSDAGAAHVTHCAERLALLTTCQSGSHFPVAGFVHEGPIYTFRDGVTTRMQGVPGSTVPADAIDASEKAVFENAPEKAFSYARISSTTRLQFSSMTGTPLSDHEGTKWLETVRAEYKAAWGKDSNRLMTARVKAAVSDFDKPGWGAGYDQFCINVAGCPEKSSTPGKCAKTWNKW